MDLEFQKELYLKGTELEKQFFIDLTTHQDEATRNAYVDYLKEDGREEAARLVQTDDIFNFKYGFGFWSGGIVIKTFGKSTIGKVTTPTIDGVFYAPSIRDINIMLGPSNSGYMYPSGWNYSKMSGYISPMHSGISGLSNWTQGIPCVNLAGCDFSSYFEKTNGVK